MGLIFALRTPLMKTMSKQAAVPTQTRHFILTPEGGLREFSAEQAARVANGATPLPEFADQRLKYVQVTVSEESAREIQVRTAGACVRFDAQGRLAEAGPPAAGETISSFEHDAVVQWTLRDSPAARIVFH